jgi:hypothetical protein
LLLLYCIYIKKVKITSKICRFQRHEAYDGEKV